MISDEQALRHELPEDRAPRRLVGIDADAEGAERLVPPLCDLVSIFAAQYVNDVRGPKPLTGAQYAGERLLRGDSAIPGFGWLVAGIAIAAGFGGLAEIIEQAHTPTAGAFAQPEQRI